MGAMGLMIDLIVLLLPVGVAATLWFAVWLAMRMRGATVARARIAGLLGGVVGLGAGVLLVVILFFPKVWAPLPVIRFETADGRVPDWIVVLEDPVRGRPVHWTGRDVPFHGVATTIAVPAGGVVRVRKLDRHFRGEQPRGVLANGAESIGGGTGPAPPGVGATGYMAWNWRRQERPEDDLPMDDAELAAWVRAREGGPSRGSAPR